VRRNADPHDTAAHRRAHATQDRNRLISQPESKFYLAASIPFCGYFSLKNKRTELWFTRKAYSYQQLLNLAAVFAAGPSN
jgi:hypothetical protein